MATPRGKSQWELRYDSLLAKAAKESAEHLEERVRLQCAVTSAVNAHLTESTFLARVRSLETACVTLSDALRKLRGIAQIVDQLVKAVVVGKGAVK
jgi:hypothetical protein